MTARPTTPDPLTGLTTEEATARLATYGGNVVPKPRPTPLWRRIVSALRDPLVLVLLAASVLTIVTRDLADTLVILAVVVVNTTVAVRQEIAADRAVDAISELVEPTCRVVRDGRERAVPAPDVVPGDLLVLAEGDLVAADAELVGASGLRVDESMLTGESVPVDKLHPAGIAAAGARPGDAAGPGPGATVVYAGTVIVHGRGTAVVRATGAASALGRIAGALTGPRVATPLQRRMAQLSGILAAATVALCVVVTVSGLLRGEPLETMLLTGVSLAVAAVPESLPVVVTISLALAARRMARRHAVVRNLAAVETLGSVTLLATDKTGTLTQARMAVADSWSVDAGADGRLLRAVALCNDARVGSPGDGAAALGDPTEVALLEAARAAGHSREDLEQELPRIAELPFDSHRKRMTTIHRMPGGGRLVVCKGAPEAVLSERVLAEPPEVLAEARARAAALTTAGARVLAVAERVEPGTGDDSAVDGVAGRAPHTHRPAPTPEDAERGLRLLGLVALADPPREAARHTVEACREAGIRIVLVTGDHAETARAIARQVGLAGTDDSPVSLGEVAAPDLEHAAGHRIIARAAPDQKLDVVGVWQKQGHVVAMTGDGVNDGPALRRADIGVAMGRRGTEVARQAADLVILDDDLATVVAAVEEGRRVYANIRRFLLYGLSGGAAEILVMLAGPAVGLALPLLPAQILWVNLLTHSLAGTALGSEPVEEGSMRQAPRDPRQGVLGGGLWWQVGVLGVAISVASLWAGVALAGDGARSAVLLTLGAAQLGVAMGARARVFDTRNPGLPLAVAGATALLLAAVLWPPLQSLLGTQDVPGRAYLLALAAAIGAGALTQLLRRYRSAR